MNFEKNIKSDIENQSSGIDSGFMSGPQLSAYDSSSEEESEQKLVKGQEIKKLNIPSSGTNQQQQQKGYTDSGCADEEDDHIITDSGLLLSENSKQHMTLDSGVDTTTSTSAAGLSESFCNLSLKDNNTKLNNLNTTIKKPSSSSSTTTAESRQQQQQQKQPWQIYYQQNSDGDTQLHIACITGYADVVSALIQLTPHPCLLDIQNDEALTALHIAVLTGQINIIRMLIVGGASPIIRDRNGNTPLHLACSFGDLECVKALTTPLNTNEIQQQQQKLLNWQQYLMNIRKSSTLSSSSELQSGAVTSPTVTVTGPTTTTTAQQTLHLSSQSQSLSSMIIFKLPQDLELRNYDGERCIHLAAQNNHINVLRYLISLGADINAREGKSGRTPLHIAIEMCNENLANFLLEECLSSLNLEIETYSGLTAYQLAVMVQFSQIQSNLEKYGAEPLTPPDSDQDSDYDDLSDDTIQSHQYHDNNSLFNRLSSSHNGQNTNTINVS